MLLQLDFPPAVKAKIVIVRAALDAGVLVMQM